MAQALYKTVLFTTNFPALRIIIKTSMFALTQKINLCTKRTPALIATDF
jgi:hypothetical protein